MVLVFEHNYYKEDLITGIRLVQVMRLMKKRHELTIPLMTLISLSVKRSSLNLSSVFEIIGPLPNEGMAKIMHKIVIKPMHHLYF